MREFVNIAKALSDPSRARALMFLCARELCLCQIIEMLGLAPSTVSKHMTILRRAGLVRSRREGRWIYYRLAGEEASACVAGALEWAKRTLRRDAQVSRDARRLGRVLRMPVEKLCARYKIGKDQ